MWSRKHWNHAHYEREVLQWVYLLLSAIDVTTDKTPSYLKEFLSQISHPVCGMCQRHIREQVRGVVNEWVWFQCLFVPGYC